MLMGLSLTAFSSEWMGIPYPMNRWGVSVLGVNQTEKGDISGISMKNETLNSAGITIVDPESIKVNAKVKLVKADYFVLPFLSVYGVYGQVDADVKLKLGDVNVPVQIPGRPDSNIRFPFPNQSLNTKGDIYGIGALIAGEYKNVFSMLQYTYSEIHMKNGLAKKKAEMANARLGYSFKPQNRYIKSFTPYIGAAYQLMDTQVKTQVEDPGLGALEAVIDLELDDITPAAGFFMQLPYDLALMVEATWGTKDSIAIDLGYRF